MAARQDEAGGAMLGISVGQTRDLSKRVIARSVEWIANRFDRLLIVVFDDPEAHVLHVFKDMTLDDARRRARDHGRQLAAGYRHAIPSAVAHRVSVALASDLLCHPACSALVDRMARALVERPDFRQALHDEGTMRMAGRLASAARAGTPARLSVEPLVSALMEEVAVTVHVGHQTDPSYPVVILPHGQPSVLTRMGDPPFAWLLDPVNTGERLRTLAVAEIELPRRSDAGATLQGGARLGGNATSEAPPRTAATCRAWMAPLR